MSMKTSDAYQSIRYGLSAVGKTATEFFQKEEFLRVSVESDLTTNMFNANKLWKKELCKKRDVKEEKTKIFGVNCKNLQSKRNQVEGCALASRTQGGLSSDLGEYYCKEFSL